MLGLSSAVMGLSAVLTGKEMAVVQFTICLVLGWVLCFIGWNVAGRPSLVRVARPDSMAAMASKCMRRLDRSRQFPEVDVGNTILPDGERALLTEQSTMFGHAARLAKVAGGSRVTVGKQSFYFGRSEPITKEARQGATQGRLILTDRALVFYGDARTFNVDLTNVTSIEPYSRDAIIVSTCGSARPSVFLVVNPILWSMVVRMAAEVPLTDGLIPDRVTFDPGTASAVRAA